MKARANYFQYLADDWEEILPSAWVDSLKEFSLQEDFQPKIELAFGIEDCFNVQREQANTPKIRICLAAEIGGAKGAYSIEAKIIYLSAEFLAQNKNNLAAVIQAFLEEYGHFIDFQDGKDGMKEKFLLLWE